MRLFSIFTGKAYQPGWVPLLDKAAATISSKSSGTMIPPALDEVALATTSGSITGSATPPAKAGAASKATNEEAATNLRANQDLH